MHNLYPHAHPSMDFTSNSLPLLPSHHPPDQLWPHCKSLHNPNNHDQHPHQRHPSIPVLQCPTTSMEGWQQLMRSIVTSLNHIRVESRSTTPPTILLMVTRRMLPLHPRSHPPQPLENLVLPNSHPSQNPLLPRPPSPTQAQHLKRKRVIRKVTLWRKVQPSTLIPLITVAQAQSRVHGGIA